MSERPPAGKVLLLTGASGVLGQAVLCRLAGEHTVVCLQHRTRVNGVPPGSRFETISGDLALPRLGLDGRGFAALAGRIEGIVHMAAATSFAAPPDAVFRVNVEGTRQVVTLAEAAEVPLYHVSTAFAHLSPAKGEPDLNAYEASKLAAEEVVRQAAVPAAILRPSLLAGDARTGVMPILQGLHLLMVLLLRNRLPILPASADSWVDFLPRDLVADVIAEKVARGEAAGEVWLTAGEQAPTLRRMLERGIDWARRELARDLVMPRIVAPEMFDRLIRPVFLPALPGPMRQSFEKLLPLIKYLNLRRRFPSSLPGLEAAWGLPLVPDLDGVLVRNVQYLADRFRLGEAGA